MVAPRRTNIDLLLAVLIDWLTDWLLDWGADGGGFNCQSESWAVRKNIAAEKKNTQQNIMKVCNYMPYLD